MTSILTPAMKETGKQETNREERDERKEDRGEEGRNLPLQAAPNGKEANSYRKWKSSEPRILSLF
jgi:hypothetical protein